MIRTPGTARARDGRAHGSGRGRQRRAPTRARPAATAPARRSARVRAQPAAPRRLRGHGVEPRRERQPPSDPGGRPLASQASDLAPPRARIGNATLSIAERCGNNNRSWNITPIGRPSGGMCEPPSTSSSTTPSSSMVPPTGCRRPAMVATRVDFPEPFGPSKAIVCPGTASKAARTGTLCVRPRCRRRASSQEPPSKRDDHRERHDDEEQRDRERGAGRSGSPRTPRAARSASARQVAGEVIVAPNSPRARAQASTAPARSAAE